MASHIRAWQRFLHNDNEPESREFDYRRRQFRRRMQSSAMLALLALALLSGYWITLERVGPIFFSIYWGTVLLIVLWVGLLAIADMIATKQYFSSLRQHYVVEEAKLQAELRRITAKEGNGRHQDPSGNGGQ